MRAGPAGSLALITLLHDRRGAAVHVDRRAGYVTGSGGCQVRDQVGGLVGLAGAAQRDPASLRQLPVVVVLVVHAVGGPDATHVLLALNDPDADGVDPDVV